MIPFGNHTVTVIERIETRTNGGKTVVSYQTNILYGCSWKSVNKRDIDYRTSSKSVDMSCRIPAAGQRCPCVGDVLILGVFDLKPTKEADVLKAIDDHRKTGAFRVISVKNNSMTGFPLAHYLCSGE